MDRKNKKAIIFGVALVIFNIVLSVLYYTKLINLHIVNLILLAICLLSIFVSMVMLFQVNRTTRNVSTDDVELNKEQSKSLLEINKNAMNILGNILWLILSFVFLFMYTSHGFSLLTNSDGDFQPITVAVYMTVVFFSVYDVFDLTQNVKKFYKDIQ